MMTPIDILKNTTDFFQSVDESRFLRDELYRREITDSFSRLMADSMLAAILSMASRGGSGTPAPSGSMPVSSPVSPVPNKLLASSRLCLCRSCRLDEPI